MKKTKDMFWYTYGDNTHRYPKEVRALIMKVQKWMNDHGMVGDAFFCTRKMWQERGEYYCRTADAIMVIDGSPMYAMLNYCENVRLYDEFYQLLQKEGYYFELGCAWYGGFYKI